MAGRNVRWLIGFLLVAVVASAAEEERPFRVSLKKTALEAVDGRATLQVTLHIPEHHKIYTKTVSVVVEETSPVRLIDLEKPAGKVVFDKILNERLETYSKDTRLAVRLQVKPGTAAGELSFPLRVNYQGCTQTVCFRPESRKFQIKLATAAVAAPAEEAAASGLSFLAIFTAFWAGALIIFTGCTFPMIPLTVGLVLGGDKSSAFRGGLLCFFYALGVAAAYGIIGTIAGALGEQIGAGILENPYVIAVVVGLFLLLALGMFGLYEFRMPGFLSRLGGGRRAAGSVIAVFITGAASAVVLSPCIGPFVLGLLAYVTQQRSPALGGLMFFAFGFGIGAPLIVLGALAGRLKQMPRSQAWMQDVQKVFGIVLVGVALFFLSALVPGSTWLAVVGAAILLLGAWNTFADRTEVQSTIYRRIKVAIGIVAILLGAFVIVRAAGGAQHFSVEEIFLFQRRLSPQWMHSEPEAVARAKREDKPLLIDFYAGWCIPCLKLERSTFADPRVVAALKNWVPLKLDITTASVETDRVKGKYDVKQPPRVLFYSPQGERIGDQVGYLPPGEFLAALAKAVAKLK